MFIADHELVEVTRGIDGDEAGEFIADLCDDDCGIRHQLMTPALTPPSHARGEVDRWIGLLPGALPQRDGGVFVIDAIRAQGERCRHRSVSFSSMRRLRL